MEASRVRGNAAPGFIERASAGRNVSAALQQVVAVSALLAGIGFLMAFVGVEKGVLDWKHRTCPVCGYSTARGCRCRVR